MKLLLVLISSLLTLAACKRTCENVKVGETELASLTKSFLSYSNGEEVTFESVTGETRTFTVSTEESVYFICQKVTCDPLDPYKSSFCEYIEAPQRSIFLNSDSTLLAIEASVFAYEPETDLLYDAVRFTISHVNNSAWASHITDVKFESPSFDQDEITEIDAYMVPANEVQLRDAKYENVLICEDERLTLYYAENEGIVGFKTGDNLWVVKN